MNNQKRILVVDDTSENLSYLTKLLEKEGYKTLPADSGELALASLENNTPDIILLDIRMPGIDGFEVCKRIKSQDKFKDIPIIFLSVATELEEKLKGFNLGAVDYITKPVQKEELLIRLKTHLSLKEKEIELIRQKGELSTLYEEYKTQSDELLLINEKITESEEKYKALYDNAPLSYQSLDIDGNFLDVNPTWLNTLGYKKEEVIGKWFGDFLRPDFVEHFKKNFPEFKKQGIISDVQFYMKKKNGDCLFISFEGCIGYTNEGDFKQTYCTFKDITEQKKAEELSKENEELFRKIYQSNVIGVAFSDENNNITGANSMFCNMLGYTEKELLVKNILDITYPEDIKQSKIIINQTRDKNNPVKKIEKRYVRKDGNIIICQTTVSKIEIVSKAKYYNVAVIEDITERKKSEKEIINYQNNLELMVKERTEEVESINEELRSSFEELTISNDNLNIANKNLEEYNKLFVGREFRIKELRDKVKELEAKL